MPIDPRIRILALLLGAAIAPVVAAVDKTAPAPAPKAAKAAPAEKSETVPYDDLCLHVGQKVTVYTKFKSTRTGMLMKYSLVELTLSIDTPDGASEMTIPKNTVDHVVVHLPDAAK